MHDDGMKEMYAKVFGDVQGVNFRNFARDKAREFGVAGYAKNLDDGAVEVVGQGSEENLKKFFNAISVGPDNAAVESAEVSYGPLPEEKFTQFDIL
jgi:acylphosphatase